MPMAVIYGTSLFTFNENYENTFFQGLPSAAFMGFYGVTGDLEFSWSKFIRRADLRLGRVWKLYGYREAIETWFYHWVSTRFPGFFHPNGLEGPLPIGKDLGPLPGSADGYRMITRFQETKLPDLMKSPGFDAYYRSCSNFQLGTIKTRIFESSLDTLLSYGIRVILVHVPVSEALEKATYTPEIWRSYKDYLNGVATAKQIPFVLLTREGCGLRDQDFEDISHLSPEGAKKVSRCLIERIAEKS